MYNKQLCMMNNVNGNLNRFSNEIMNKYINMQLPPVVKERAIKVK